MVLLRLVLLLNVLLLAACQSRRGLEPGDLPTPADLDALATVLPLTQYAPPPPYTSGTDDFALVDNGLTDLPGWRYVVQFQFSGAYADTGEPFTAAATAEVTFNQLASARRITFTAQGDLLGTGSAADTTRYEAVRLGPDAFLVRDNACSTGPSAAAAADLRAGDLIGGVSMARPAGRPGATINGEAVHPFAVTPDVIALPAVTVPDGARLTLDSGELWISADRRAVVRFYANLTGDSVRLFSGERPVSGTILLRYDLYDVGTAFNLTVPFGC